MSIKTIVTFVILSTFNLSFGNCLENPFQKSNLPKEMPADTRMSFSENGGMAPTWYRVEIAENELTIEEKTFKDNEARVYYAEISRADKEELYQVFVTNKFDTVENDERKEIVYDAGSEGVYIRAGKVSKQVSYGKNSPLTGRNLTRYKLAAEALKKMAAKYKPQAKERKDNFAEIEYNPKKHKFIFEKGRRTNLNNLEIEKLNTLLEKAVADHNAKTKNDDKIADLKKYKLQFLAITNENGEKEVYINCFCLKIPNWKKELVVVDDGGSCFFNLTVNLNKNEYSNFAVNGVA